MLSFSSFSILKHKMQPAFSVCEFVLFYIIWASVLVSSLLSIISRMVLKTSGSPLLSPPFTEELGPMQKTCRDRHTRMPQVPCILCCTATCSAWVYLERETLSIMETVAGIRTACGFGAQGRSLICAVSEEPA